MLPDGLNRCLAWYGAASAPAAVEVCSSRDVFQARLDSLLRLLTTMAWPSNEAALLVAVLGEIGNNCFDHNLGRWRDTPGCWLGNTAERDNGLFWIADRGVGMLETLRRADSSLREAQQAVDAAFVRMISGRAPERRGNGLKFVRAVVNGGAPRALVCRSGGGEARFGSLIAELTEAESELAEAGGEGTAMVVAWRVQT